MATGKTYTVSPNGTLLENGKPIFLFGGYTVSFSSGVEAMKRDIEIARDLGWNHQMLSYNFNSDLTNNTAVWSLAAQNKITLTCGDLELGWTEQNSAFASSPVGMAVGIADDANYAVLADIQNNVAYVKANMPNTLTYLSLGYTTSFPNGNRIDYIKACDLVGNQAYPIPDDPIDTVFTSMQAFSNDCTLNGRCPIANIDFQVKNITQGRMPTIPELNAMTFLSLQAGVKGLMFYTVIDQYNRTINHTAHYNNLKNLRGIIRPLEKFFISTTPATISTVDTKIRATRWTLGTEALIMITNTTDSPRTITVTLPQILKTGKTTISTIQTTLAPYETLIRVGNN